MTQYLFTEDQIHRMLMLYTLLNLKIDWRAIKYGEPLCHSDY
jgi:hypothetical protein